MTGSVEPTHEILTRLELNACASREGSCEPVQLCTKYGSRYKTYPGI